MLRRSSQVHEQRFQADLVKARQEAERLSKPKAKKMLDGTQRLVPTTVGGKDDMWFTNWNKLANMSRNGAIVTDGKIMIQDMCSECFKERVRYARSCSLFDLLQQAIKCSFCHFPLVDFLPEGVEFESASSSEEEEEEWADETGEERPQKLPPHERRLEFAKPLRLTKAELIVQDPAVKERAKREKEIARKKASKYSVEGESHYKHLFSQAQASREARIHKTINFPAPAGRSREPRVPMISITPAPAPAPVSKPSSSNAKGSPVRERVWAGLRNDAISTTVNRQVMTSPPPRNPPPKNKGKSTWARTSDQREESPPRRTTGQRDSASPTPRAASPLRRKSPQRGDGAKGRDAQVQVSVSRAWRRGKGKEGASGDRSPVAQVRDEPGLKDGSPYESLDKEFPTYASRRVPRQGRVVTVVRKQKTERGEFERGIRPVGWDAGHDEEKIPESSAGGFRGWRVEEPHFEAMDHGVRDVVKPKEGRGFATGRAPEPRYDPMEWDPSGGAQKLDVFGDKGGGKGFSFGSVDRGYVIMDWSSKEDVEAGRRRRERRKSYKWVAGHSAGGPDKVSFLSSLFAPPKSEDRPAAQPRSKEEIEATVNRLYSRSTWLAEEEEINRLMMLRDGSHSPGLRLVHEPGSGILLQSHWCGLNSFQSKVVSRGVQHRNRIQATNDGARPKTVDAIMERGQGAASSLSSLINRPPVRAITPTVPTFFPFGFVREGLGDWCGVTGGEVERERGMEMDLDRKSERVVRDLDARHRGGESRHVHSSHSRQTFRAQGSAGGGGYSLSRNGGSREASLSPQGLSFQIWSCESPREFDVEYRPINLAVSRSQLRNPDVNGSLSGQERGGGGGGGGGEEGVYRVSRGGGGASEGRATSLKMVKRGSGKGAVEAGMKGKRGGSPVNGSRSPVREARQTTLASPPTSEWLSLPSSNGGSLPHRPSTSVF